MVTYLEKNKSSYQFIPLICNLGSSKSEEFPCRCIGQVSFHQGYIITKAVSMEFLPKPCINQRPMVIELDQELSWMNPILAYLKTGELPEDKIEARVLRVKAACYIVNDDKLYKRSYSVLLLRYVIPFEANYIVMEIHESICGNHARNSHWHSR